MVIKATKTSNDKCKYNDINSELRGKTKKVQILVKRHHNQYMTEIKSRIYAWSY